MPADIKKSDIFDELQDTILLAALGRALVRKGVLNPEDITFEIDIFANTDVKLGQAKAEFDAVIARMKKAVLTWDLE